MRRDPLFRRELLMTVDRRGPERAARFDFVLDAGVKSRDFPVDRGWLALAAWRRQGMASKAWRAELPGNDDDDGRTTSRCARSIFRFRGTSFTATRARSPGGWRRPARSSSIVCVTRGGLVPAAIVARELNVRLIETVCVESYAGSGVGRQGELRVLKGIADSDHQRHACATGQGVLIVDDLVDTGKTARVVREMIPKAHFATVYAKPMGRPLVDTFVTEVSQDTWIFFPWDTGLAFVPPIREGG